MNARVFLLPLVGLLCQCGGGGSGSFAAAPSGA